MADPRNGEPKSLIFGPHLTHTAARSLCDSWATCIRFWSKTAVSVPVLKTVPILHLECIFLTGHQTAVWEITQVGRQNKKSSQVNPNTCQLLSDSLINKSQQSINNSSAYSCFSAILNNKCYIMWTELTNTVPCPCQALTVSVSNSSRPPSLSDVSK